MIIHEDSHLDRYDVAILKILSQDGRIPVTELSTRVGLSKTPCQVRMKRLISEGYILGFKAVLNPTQLGAEQVAFVEVKLKKTTEEAIRESVQLQTRLTNARCYLYHLTNNRKRQKKKPNAALFKVYRFQSRFEHSMEENLYMMLRAFGVDPKIVRIVRELELDN